MKTQFSEIVRLLAILFGSLALACQCAAAPPPNDDFANRGVLTGTNVTVVGSNVGATREADEPNPFYYGSSANHSVWWTWTAPGAGRVNVQE
ncbi:MAG TPA: hypothetical protein VFC17_05135, partial [Candidatus Limnocylindrales bacterium]|nr:hypothetical protein [Candidatus Limnocylindrales bacterium]